MIRVIRTIRKPTKHFIKGLEIFYNYCYHGVAFSIDLIEMRVPELIMYKMTAYPLEIDSLILSIKILQHLFQAAQENSREHQESGRVDDHRSPLQSFVLQISKYKKDIHTLQMKYPPPIIQQLSAEIFDEVDLLVDSLSLEGDDLTDQVEEEEEDEDER